ncbi:TetM/TetW/TetO/TetS family tetracycline resistance ribosomal protection protein [Saccharopolyspora hirsuta]|uniref:TetM/TetW/TetO/TetS family tetracycline resistance ribosomal protection protein n=1 Tax=Saccharopolyspora hirsuta TaxID=1837 RepID=A0A5M7B9G6_SACHI|nr:TetM/TetW/TetO/TetS family tetracycline resistance ribosomal protection protein [Saccharopolyspora hirsuta]KAA5826072.1 TetM/TetW/TetO/TetS family tetracycline resistance ribosomal protection protein [Saccharopolyspora hirsuta]
MRTLNLGILAHVDAGKTSLTERLLHAAGVTDRLGSVDRGDTRTDSLALERQRGITIKSAVVSFVVADVAVNLIDTPGHPDFIAEVERVLGVLDGAVLVISAVEGVQAQTRVLMRTLQRLQIPTLVFVNKIDRSGARVDQVLRDVAAKLTPAIVPMTSAVDAGTRDAAVSSDVAVAVDVLAEHDEALLAAYVGDEPIPPSQLRNALVQQAKRALVHPVYCGSATTGAGVAELIAGIAELLPAAEGDADGPASGTVFKVERGPAGEKIAYARMFSGTLRTRDRLPGRSGAEQKVTAISVFDRGGTTHCDSVSAGRIGKLWGLGEVRIGDAIGTPRRGPDQHFAPPTLEAVVVPRRRADRGALHVALTQLAEQDPLIDLRQDDVRQEISVSLYGEVQKEVVQATLAAEYGIDVDFRDTVTICVERPLGAGTAVEVIGEPHNPFLATVGLRVEPATSGAGVDFRLGVELGSMPPAFFKAVEEAVLSTLRQGLRGWQVGDCVVTMTHSGYWARQSRAHGTFDKSMSSTAGDFRNLTPLVLMTALRRAGTAVHEPVHHFRLDIPADALSAVAPAVARSQGVPQATTTRGASTVVEGELPAARVHELQQRLPGLTRGEGVLETWFARYAPVRGEPPVRPRADHNPLDREEYLLRVARRTG